MGKKLSVFNLEFPSWCPELNIFSYRFTRVTDYEDQVKTLHHLVTSQAEIKKPINPGTHAVTANVEIPEKEESCVLLWSDRNHTALNDLLLLLSIFTGREVFIVSEEILEEGDFGITADPRQYQWGGILRCSIPHEYISTAVENPYLQEYGILEKDGQGEWVPIDLPRDPSRYNIGFEKGVNRIYQLIRSEEWQTEYKGGYFLFLARAAFRRQILESSFLQCWTIWEHLFTVHNENWLSKNAIRRLDSIEKVAFILAKYGLSDPVDHERIKPLVEVRNRLVHLGQFPERDSTEEAESLRENADLFIRLTEVIIANIFDLEPSNVFNTKEKLEALLQTHNNNG